MENLPEKLKKSNLYYNIQKFKIEINKLSEEIETLEKSIGECLDIFHKKNKDYSSKYEDLSIELHILKIKHGGKVVPSSTIKNTPDCKSIYNKICKICHPDISNGDEELTAVFRIATDAYDLNNLKELQKILKDIENKNISNILLFMNTNIDELQKEYNETKEKLYNKINKLNSIKHSEIFRIFEHSQSEDDIDKMMANKLYIDFMIYKIIDINNQKKEMEKNVKH